MRQTLPNGVIISDHHPYGRTWHQFIQEQAERDENLRLAETADYLLCSRTDERPVRTFHQWFAPYNLLHI